ncbi:MAG: hypothetical protein HOK35_15210 [Cytophagia bacterium]|jgi:hypothetical protein|nr:hypothetical protein [Cytophagia bacterium]
MPDKDLENFLKEHTDFSDDELSSVIDAQNLWSKKEDEDRFAHSLRKRLKEIDHSNIKYFEWSKSWVLFLIAVIVIIILIWKV